MNFPRSLFWGFSLFWGVFQGFLSLNAEASSGPLHGMAIYGELKYPKDFKNFDYVNPNAPKGGTLRQEEFGSFDSFNPFVIKGNAAAGLEQLVYARLLAQSIDEPGSFYGYVAESLEVATDRSWVIFSLRPQAAFQDGTPLRAEDVVYSFKKLMEQGLPFYKAYYKGVTQVEALTPLKVKFSLENGASRELPLILGQFPIFSKTFIEKHGFEKTDLTPPLGSGPYKIKDFKAGHFVIYEHVPQWWGANLPVNRGRYNFDHLRHDYFRDHNIAFEAFKSHTFDFHFEISAKNWATGYDFPAFQKGEVHKEETEELHPASAQLWIFNTRRPPFDTLKVREALGYAFDFEWANQHLFYGAYRRTKSYFDRSELASSRLPEGEELRILEGYKDQLPSSLFSTPFTLPQNPTPLKRRENLSQALKLLKEAGWRIQNNRLVQEKTGKPFTFEILLNGPSLERVAQGFVASLKRLGIEAHIRTVDSSQYIQRVENYDFDMIFASLPQSATPGNEQRQFWLSTRADLPGGFNFAGVKSPVIDALVQLVIEAPDQEALIQRVRALDRVLLWGYYGILGWHSPGTRFAYWHPLQHPPLKPSYGFDLMSWWMAPSSSS